MANQVRRRAKVHLRRQYSRDHKIKKRIRSRVNAGARFRQKKRRFHRRAHPGWKKITKEYQVSADLQAVIGRPRASRGQISNLIWRYIRDHHLQNQGNARLFTPDVTLARLVGNQGRLLDGIRMMDVVNAHIVKENWIVFLHRKLISVYYVLLIIQTLKYPNCDKT
jgi:chromatin remodeling complex protein RSC6